MLEIQTRENGWISACVKEKLKKTELRGIRAKKVKHK